MIILYMLLCDICAPPESGHQSTLSCFRTCLKPVMRRNPSRKQNTVYDIWFKKRNMFQERVYVDEHIMPVGWLHGH